MRVNDGDSAVMRWVTDTISDVGLPEFRLTGQAATPLKALPVPAGFELDSP